MLPVDCGFGFEDIAEEFKFALDTELCLSDEDKVGTWLDSGKVEGFGKDEALKTEELCVIDGICVAVLETCDELKIFDDLGTGADDLAAVFLLGFGLEFGKGEESS